jgi:hypothetical protein
LTEFLLGIAFEDLTTDDLVGEVDEFLLDRHAATEVGKFRHGDHQGQWVKGASATGVMWP